MAETKFAEWLRVELERRPGMTAGMMAEQAHMPRASAYAYLKGTRVPGEEALVKIAGAFGMERASMPPFSSK